MTIDKDEMKALIAKMIEEGKIIPAPKIAKKNNESRVDYGTGNCPQCKRSFKKRAFSSTYCGRICYDAKKRADRAAENSKLEPVVCRECSKEFVPKNRNTQRYCTPDCAITAANARRMATHRKGV